MQVGMLTSPFGREPLENVIAFAGANGFDALEVASGPGGKHIDITNLTDARVSEIYPGRIYFFPTTRSECYRRSSISVVFRAIWKDAGLVHRFGNKPRAYDLRHHFALSSLNRWIASGVDVNSKLPHLSRYMGHSCIESTDYYLHLVPEFFQTFSEKVRTTEAVLPEVDYEQQ